MTLDERIKAALDAHHLGIDTHPDQRTVNRVLLGDLRQELAELTEKLNKWQDLANKNARERDEAFGAMEDLRKALMRATKERHEALEEVTRLLKMREEDASEVHDAHQYLCDRIMSAVYERNEAQKIAANFEALHAKGEKDYEAMRIALTRRAESAEKADAMHLEHALWATREGCRLQGEVDYWRNLANERAAGVLTKENADLKTANASLHAKLKDLTECKECDGTGETWLGHDYSGHKDCKECNGTGSDPSMVLK